MTAPLIPVAGAEVFASRPIPLDELRTKIHPSLKLHEIDPVELDRIDALTYEVIRHRIWSVTDEMGQMLRRMSGSPEVTEANDYGFAISDEFGQEVQVGLFNTGIVASMDLAIYWILQNRSENPGIEPGDMFLTNDPWAGGGLHQNDTAIIAPIFWEGEVFGWTTSVFHLVDVGGSKAGSADLTANDVFSESPPTPPVKIVRKGVLQNDVLDVFTRHSRLPLQVNLDLRAEIGANNVAQQGITKLIEKYGPTTVKAVMKRMMNDAERRLRDRLRSIPDGTWSSTTYIEQAVVGDRDMHKIELNLTKKDDHLTLDFRGTDPSVGMINSPYSGMRAAALVGILPILAGDMPWSTGGLMRCFDIVSELGTINNAAFPAAVGWAPLSAMWASSNAVVECLSSMLGTSLELRHRANAVCTACYDIVTLAGLDEEGMPFVSIDNEAMAGGYGAAADHDGQDTGGVLCIPTGRTPDVEMHEFLHPHLILWRRESTDSGGAGTYRGGLSIDEALIPHGTPIPMFASMMGNGKARPGAVGLAGGYPGGAQRDVIVRGADVSSLFEQGVMPASLDEIGGTQESIPSKYETLVGLEDVVFLHPSGGGGYGDPLLRDPSAVARDVLESKVSAESARDLYGVVLADDGAVDVPATEARRRQIRAARLGDGAEPAAVGGFGGADHQHHDPNTVIVSQGGASHIACEHCGHALAPEGSDYTDALHAYVGSLAEGGPGVLTEPRQMIDVELEFRQLCCPSCGTAMRTTVDPAAG